jgi:hypothetical protein
MGPRYTVPPSRLFFLTALTGDVKAYHSRIAQAARDLANRCDAVVLAQASMEPAAALLTGLTVPVPLSSPRQRAQWRRLWCSPPQAREFREPDVQEKASSTVSGTFCAR